MDTAWTPSDVLLLRSISGHDAATGAPLRGVIGTADYLDHSVPNEWEFVEGVGRLVAAGLAGYDLAADRYWLTPLGHASPAHRGTFSAATAALPALTGSTPVPLPPCLYAAVVETYLRG